MFENIRGIIVFRAEGDKIYQFINAIKSEGIVCKNQRCINNCFYGEIYADKWRKLLRLSERYNMQLSIERKKGWKYKVLKYKKRYGILAGLILIPVIILMVSNTIVIIEINGNEKISDTQIISALEDIGIKKGAKISETDFANAESLLRLSLDNVVWTAIRHTGCRVVVDIDESEKEPELLNERIPANIVASKDAQIVSVNVLMGQLKKLIGEGVREGEVVISGIYSDKKGQIMHVHALGDIIGIYDESVIFSQEFNGSERFKTGNILEQKYFEIFGFRIPLFIKKDLFDDYEYFENTEHFEIYEKRLPFGIVTERYTEYSERDIVYSQEQVEGELMQKVIRYENNFLKDTEILEREIQKDIKDDKIDYIINYRLKGNIAQTKEIFSE